MAKPPAPTRPGPWISMWHNFWASFSRAPQKRYVGEDTAGNRFYEYVAGQRRGNVQRGFEAPPSADGSSPPSLEWRAWLSMARRFPPSEEEIQLNTLKQQAQLVQNEETEKRAPTIESTGVGAADIDQKRNFDSNEFPRFGDDYEKVPGAKKQEQLKKEMKAGKWKYKEFFFEKGWMDKN